MPYNYSPYELALYRNNPDRPIPGTGGIGPGMNYAQYMASRGGGGPGSTPEDWLKADKERRDQQAADEAKPSEVTNILYRRRDYERGLLDSYGKDALAENDRNTGRELAGVDQSTARRGLYSTTVRDALRGRTMEAGARTRAAIEGQIANYKANQDYQLTGDIASNLQHEIDRKAGYANALAYGQAQSKAQEKSGLLGFLGTLGGGLLGAL